MVILGIDPGTAALGYGVLRKTGFGKRNKFKLACLSFGLISTTPDMPFPKRLEKISKEFNVLVKKYRPDLIAIESVFFFKNLKTFIPVSRAEGVIILGAAKNNVAIIEFSPIQIKARVAGYGRAEKKDVLKKVLKLLKLKEVPKPDDIADALAVAACAAIGAKTLDNLS